MKKIAIAAITATSILALSACSSGDKEVIAKNRRRRCHKRRALHKHEENSWRKRTDTASARKSIDKKYKVSDKEIDNKLKEYKTQLGDQYTALEKQYGKDYLKEQVKYELLTQKSG